MKITDIHIYGYGKLTDFSLTDIQSFQVIYGENEAGKSTIMSFIHSILFGFPTKLQSELRYEPKEGAKYGGRLKAVFPGEGKAIIERVKGKAAGDVSVILEDGTRGGEELLSELLHHVDRSLFQSIFSFNIHGLQNINQMKGEDLGRYLFSAGSLGTDQLVTAENTLQRDLESRFKPNGKKPSLNIKLNELKKLHQNLKKAEQQNEQYWTLLHEKETLEKKITRMQDDQQYTQQKLYRLKEWRELYPLITEERELKREREQFKDISFPVDGMAKVEKLESLIHPLEGRKASLEARIGTLRQELEKNKPDYNLLENEPQINAAIEGIPLLEKLRQEESELSLKLANLTEEILILQEKLHLQIDETQLEEVDTSVFMKEKVNKAQMRHNRLLTKKSELDERFNDERSALEDIESKLDGLKDQLLTETERAAIKEKLSLSADRNLLEKELEDTQERILFLHKAEEKERKNSSKKRKQEKAQLLVIGILFAVLFGWGLWSQTWVLAFAGLIGIAYCGFMVTKKHSQENHSFIKDEIVALAEKESTLKDKLKQPQIQHAAKLEAQLQEDSELQSLLRQYKFQHVQANEKYEKVIGSFEEWEKEYADVDKEMIGLGNLLFLPADISKSHLPEAFSLIEQLKALYREKSYVMERKTAAAQGIQEKLINFQHLKELLNEQQGSVQEVAYQFRKRLKEETEKHIKLAERKAKLHELEDEYSTVLAELEHFNKEYDQQLALAGTETAEDYREKGIAAQKLAELDEQIKQIRKQINIQSFSQNEIDKYMNVENPEMAIHNLTEELNKLRDSIPSLQSSLAEIKYEIQLLEEGGTYAELLHTFALLKAEFEEEAREWAKYAAAKDILEKTISSFKNERLPKMLETAEEYLSCLTNGNYVRIYPKEEGHGFLIESKEGATFEAKELSQATAEQIYVSFRLALAMTIYGKYPFPIIIDDSFVNFDHVRTEKMISLLKNIPDRQILFFTCHKHLLPYFQEEQIMSVTKEKLPVRK
ncbi:AAA family ATPase [Bacillus sp. ISL-47]|uniref:AAA family ATPase n=1 Tax=Bacillus sp. ISL-47 TaxID=2819130 RepID=UPI001BE5515E|nr:AAA family ATPase [Bacillus sp. ISL-47]MBT2688919.1 AAA family ATPase [Bacillus sp. ISL-47]MBT2708802.1 AAA family ATPase [Pseudomonas sp. ISL-84]